MYLNSIYLYINMHTSYSYSRSTNLLQVKHMLKSPGGTFGSGLHRTRLLFTACIDWFGDQTLNEGRDNGDIATNKSFK